MKNSNEMQSTRRLKKGFFAAVLSIAIFDSFATGQTTTLPYRTDFEASEGYTLGSINGQLNWSVPQGSAQVVNTSAFSGTQSVALSASIPVAQLTNAFAAVSGQNVAYVDFVAEPVADASIASSTLFDAGSARVGFLLSSGSALIQVFNGDGVGGGAWITPTLSTALALSTGSNQTATWHRFTFREDFSAKTWDLYVDGQMIAYDLKFHDPTTSGLSGFTVSGHATAPTGLDLFYAGFINPLFTNTSNDGISDAWKIQYGLDPAQNLRYSSPNGNGITAIQDYVTGANPLDYFNGRAIAISPPASSNQWTYSYDASGRLTSIVFAKLSKQTFALDNAANLTSVAGTNQPIVNWRIAAGLPPDGSGTGADSAAPANDNLPNLAKYALGLAPLTAAQGSYPSVLLVQNAGSNYLAVEYHRPDPGPADLTYTVEVSPDAQSWVNGPSATTTVSTNISGGVADVIVRDNTAISSPQYGRYIRLRIIRTIQP